MNQEKPTQHRAVMVSEVIEALKPRSGGRYLDATLGGATHSQELLKLSAPDGRVLSLDVDLTALGRAREMQPAYGDRWKIVESNFRHLKQAAQESGWMPFDGILFDLGLSSDELADPSKGLSFQIDGPLDMRLGPKANDDGLTAYDIVNRWTERELIDLIRTYGEDRFAPKIAQAIVMRRREKKFETTLDLAECIKDAVPLKHLKIHPATKTFQALRMAVNDELATLRLALETADEILADGGTIVVISFHSLEDRIVKQTFKKLVGYEITKKPICPTEAEVKNNSRARSAKMRAARKNTTKNNLCHEPTPLL
ncbi:MAG: 16S rRNA (cytosine(1402)-N(4))-methyltransferase RsmH [Patescibacteria group bacterium]|nr:16S rRNA (cytosine(1402)-N(4))-methyltransferase RsmH [Patescibacteria group bacterium]